MSLGPESMALIWQHRVDPGNEAKAREVLDLLQLHDPIVAALLNYRRRGLDEVQALRIAVIALSVERAHTIATRMQDALNAPYHQADPRSTCPGCGQPALDGKVTCGSAACGPALQYHNGQLSPDWAQKTPAQILDDLRDIARRYQGQAIPLPASPPPPRPGVWCGKCDRLLPDHEVGCEDAPVALPSRQPVADPEAVLQRLPVSEDGLVDLGGRLYRTAPGDCASRSDHLAEGAVVTELGHQPHRMQRRSVGELVVVDCSRCGALSPDSD